MGRKLEGIDKVGFFLLAITVSVCGNPFLGSNRLRPKHLAVALVFSRIAECGPAR